MGQLERYTNAGTAPSGWSKAGRDLARIVTSTEVAVSRVASQASLENARLDAIDGVAARGLQGVAMVTQLEQQLAQAVPLAASRLQAIGDMHALTTAQEMASFTRRMR
jgi:hypothetical protein